MDHEVVKVPESGCVAIEQSGRTVLIPIAEVFDLCDRLAEAAVDLS